MGRRCLRLCNASLKWATVRCCGSGSVAPYQRSCWPGLYCNRFLQSAMRRASTMNLLNVPTEVDISSPLLFTCLVALRAEVEISVLSRHSRSAALQRYEFKISARWPTLATLPANRLPEAVTNARSPSLVRCQPASFV